MRNSLWDEHLERLSAIHGVEPRPPARPATVDAVGALRGEWDVRPPGRLGRRLLVDVERYLDFFAVARQ
jgi:hypothetical protein